MCEAIPQRNKRHNSAEMEKQTKIPDVKRECFTPNGVITIVKKTCSEVDAAYNNRKPGKAAPRASSVNKKTVAVPTKSMANVKAPGLDKKSTAQREANSKSGIANANNKDSGKGKVMQPDKKNVKSGGGASQNSHALVKQLIQRNPNKPVPDKNVKGRPFVLYDKMCSRHDANKDDGGKKSNADGKRNKAKNRKEQHNNTTARKNTKTYGMHRSKPKPHNQRKNKHQQ